MTRLTRALLPIAALLALSVRLLVPAGYMPGHAAAGWTFDICTGHGPMQIALVGGSTKPSPARPSPVQASVVCNFAGLAAPLMPVALTALLTLALAVAIGLAPTRRARVPVMASRRLRPPLRGPPSV